MKFDNYNYMRKTREGRRTSDQSGSGVQDRLRVGRRALGRPAYMYVKDVDERTEINLQWPVVYTHLAELFNQTSAGHLVSVISEDG